MTQVTLRLFATLRDRAGFGSKTIQLKTPATVSDLLRYLEENYPALNDSLPNSIVAVNQEYAFEEAPLQDGDDVAIFPPVSGGTWPTYFAITEEMLDVNAILQHITQPETGGVCIFTGAVRGITTQENNVLETHHLVYESYKPMAESKLQQVAEEIWQQYPNVQGIAIVQRIGKLEIGETTVLVACAAGHRDQGIFEAARYGIDRLKEIVPVWKKEVGADGSMWVEGHYHPTPEDISDKKSVKEDFTFACTVCNNIYPHDTEHFRCECGKPFKFQQTPRFNQSAIKENLASLWRYQDMILPSGITPISMSEGWTPLIETRVDDHQVYFKLESLNPTGSFKDRGASLLVSILKAHRKTSVHDDSSGNAGAALAAYAARAGLKAQLFVPAYASPAKLAQIRLYGAELTKVEGPRSAATDASIMAVTNSKSSYASHIYHPFAVLGYRTIAYEIWEQLGYSAPDIIIVPVGHGSQYIGLFEGFTDLLKAGLIDNLPRLIGVQARRCAPLWQMLHHAQESKHEGQTLAEGIRITEPVRAKEILAAVKKTNGDIIAVEEEDIRAGIRQLGKLGINAEPTSAVVWPALTQIIRQLTKETTIVIPITGSGHKTPSLSEIIE